jgi:hypothetical protein
LFAGNWQYHHFGILSRAIIVVTMDLLTDFIHLQKTFLLEQQQLLNKQLAQLNDLESGLPKAPAVKASITIPLLAPSPAKYSNSSKASQHADKSPLLKEAMKVSKDEKASRKEEKLRLKVEEKLATKAEKLRLKKEVDPNKPKKPLSAYLMFCNAELPKLRAKMHAEKTADVEVTHKDVMTKLGSIWNGLSVEEKDVYNDRVEEEKAAYGLKMLDYTRLKSCDPDASLPPALAVKPVQDETVIFEAVQDETVHEDSERRKSKKKKRREGSLEPEMVEEGVSEEPQTENGESKKQKKIKKKHRQVEEE